MKKLTLLYVFLGFLLVNFNVAAHDFHRSNRWHWTIEDIFNAEETPFAIGHRGYGENLGEIEDKPIENTTRAVRRAYRVGIKIVEIDVVLTRDNRVVALHDNYLDVLLVSLLQNSDFHQIIFANKSHSYFKKINPLNLGIG